MNNMFCNCNKIISISVVTESRQQFNERTAFNLSFDAEHDGV
jgi:hypothetical protein